MMTKSKDVTVTGPLAEGQRWSVACKREVALRLLRGESVDDLSRELGIEIYRLEQWREKALVGIDESLKQRQNDPIQSELNQAMRRIGELTMENELLWERALARADVKAGYDKLEEEFALLDEFLKARALRRPRWPNVSAPPSRPLPGSNPATADIRHHWPPCANTLMPLAAVSNCAW
jgi:transposase-like protein